MFRSREERLNRTVERLVRGRRLPQSLPEDAELVQAAAALAAGRDSDARMSPDLRRRIAKMVEDRPDEAFPTRRTALGAAAGIAVGALGVAAFERFAGTRAAPAQLAGRAPAAIAGGIMQPAGGRWIGVATLADLVEAQPLKVVAGDLVAYVFRRGDEVSAVSGMCSHLPCALDWRRGSAHLNCPCHNVNFSPDGLPLEANYEVPALPQIAVRVRNGTVEVRSG